jgi:menaquinone-dependent protoporphyrinogen oxidase
MSTLIIYATRHGCARKCASLLAEGLAGEVIQLNIKDGEARKMDFSRFESIIVGGSIHAGQLQKTMKEFMRDHGDLLRRKKLGLFLCHMEEGDTARKQMEVNIPEDLRAHASALGLFGGEFDFDRMNFLEKAIVKKVAGVEKTVSRIDKEAVKTFLADFTR